ncbi:hypothetical protein [Streptomyces sp. AA0539]|uniref:hypothetical protein n=1 Tax=Streptomyces sp. AA0539 TaxID=1210045 RepID=UPI0003116FE0|nr:hypothetical protein [Streptomyces sp. AA0539]
MTTVVPAAERGATRIAERVVAKLAAQAAREALPPGGPGARPSATAVLRPARGLARIRVAVELAYPPDIGAQCGAVRRRIVSRVRELADLEASEVAVDVERLHTAESGGTGAAGARRVR